MQAKSPHPLSFHFKSVSLFFHQQLSQLSEFWEWNRLTEQFVILAGWISLFLSRGFRFVFSSSFVRLNWDPVWRQIVLMSRFDFIYLFCSFLLMQLMDLGSDQTEQKMNQRSGRITFPHYGRETRDSWPCTDFFFCCWGGCRSVCIFCA